MIYEVCLDVKIHAGQCLHAPLKFVHVNTSGYDINVVVLCQVLCESEACSVLCCVVFLYVFLLVFLLFRTLSTLW